MDILSTEIEGDNNNRDGSVETGSDPSSENENELFELNKRLFASGESSHSSYEDLVEATSKSPRRDQTLINNNRVEMSSTKEVTIGGRKLVVSTREIVKEDVIVKSAIDRTQRRKLPADKLDSYLERMRRTIVKKPFQRFNNKIDLKDADELIEASDLLANIGKLRQHLRDYDADDVFTIVKYDKKDPGNLSADSFTDILNLEKLFSVTRDEVAESNTWWHSVIEGEDAVTVHENLRMSLLFFENNVESKLHLTIMDEIEKFLPQERGGPLYFIILIEMILNDGVSIALNWTKRVRELDIKSIEGEDILLFSKYVRGLLSLCKALEEAGSATIVTADFPDIIINLLCNTSSEDFNDVFRQKRTSKLIGIISGAEGVTGSSVIRSRLTALNNVYDEVKQLLDAACDVYTRLSGSPEWSGMHHKASAFLVTGCFNCGDPNCTVSTCKKPINQQKVDERKKLWFSERKERDKKKKEENGGSTGRGHGGRGRGGRGGRGRGGRGQSGRGGRGANRSDDRWSEPTSAEKDEASRERRKPRRMIKRGREQRDTLNEYLFDSNRWVEIQANVSTNDGASDGRNNAADRDAARDAVHQSANFNRSEMSDRDYRARIANMELAISRVRESWA